MPVPGGTLAIDSSRITCTGLTRRFGSRGGAVEALGPIDLRVPEGQFLSLVGPSGCGKSTLLRIVAGLTNPSGGRVDVRVSKANPMAMVFQDYGVYPWKRVAANVRFGLDCAGVDRRSADERVRAWLARTRLTDFADAWPDQLSGGMRQRVALARALVTEPEVLLLDEPFAALDPQLRRLMQDELLELTQLVESPPTVVMVTHSLSEALVLSDRIVVLSNRPGTVIADVDLPFGRPRTPAVRVAAEVAHREQQLWEVLRDEVVGAAAERHA